MPIGKRVRIIILKPGKQKPPGDWWSDTDSVHIEHQRVNIKRALQLIPGHALHRLTLPGRGS